jgi:uncharacterized repeat protein (TIGR03837 family)
LNAIRTPLRWELFCRVVDNLGDAAVMWRLARQLAMEHRRQVRLHIDRPAVLQRLVPQAKIGATVDGVGLVALKEDARKAAVATADVVVTGFHAALPASFRARMTPGRPVWINLEYLSAEAWIEGFHRLPSPHADGLVEHYFYPGFGSGSGGLLREADLFTRRDRFQADPGAARRFLAELGVQRAAGETLASLLSYPGAPLGELARQLAGSATRLQLLVPDGVPIDSTPAALVEAGGGRLRLSRIPFVRQRQYDELLWSCDFNFVRGEDSLVRGIWSNRPFVWQIYRQADDAHIPKLESFLRLLAADPLPDAMRWWNRLPQASPTSLVRLVSDAPTGFGRLDAGLVQRVATPDLASRLLDFAASLSIVTDTAEKSTGQL